MWYINVAHQSEVGMHVILFVISDWMMTGLQILTSASSYSPFKPVRPTPI